MKKLILLMAISGFLTITACNKPAENTETEATEATNDQSEAEALEAEKAAAEQDMMTADTAATEAPAEATPAQ